MTRAPDSRVRALALGVSDAVVVAPEQVVGAERVRMKCLCYSCPSGRCLTCPPHPPTLVQMRALLDESQTILPLRFDVPPAQAGEWVT